ncbi:hypothetical protein A6U87_27455 [Rhizobium sp. AC44/96]|uniref:hypothetical protein n=1 Tax=Rhizobium sp. AC44/96 TaxID=1841654 RepID=UPI00080FA7FF|nr:hypothetical protein [Rhizobium sp. AC44/96]OCJ11481.1 hypothetical protein A6U87_27455 [Rhizobium sp. AC44/96]
MQIDQQLDARQTRRMKSERRFLERMERRELAAEAMIGELCREGRTVFYAWPQGGKYREGSRGELVSFLTRNRYA